MKRKQTKKMKFYKRELGKDLARIADNLVSEIVKPSVIPPDSYCSYLSKHLEKLSPGTYISFREYCRELFEEYIEKGLTWSYLEEQLKLYMGDYYESI